jgi:single-stranded-DNA-specific exonuclease
MMVQWIDPQPVDVPAALRSAADEFARPPVGGALVAELLVRRGIEDPGHARGFLDPAAYTPAPPEAVPDLDLAAERLACALREGEHIAVWGDFDVDGQTATALYVQALRDLGGDVSFHIPSRRASHGLHSAGVGRLIEAGVRLILTADTGIDGHRAVERAQGQGVDVLITDHHDLPEVLPRALATVNVKRLPPSHPLRELPGVGVAHQVVRALYGRAGRDADHLLDLVALGIVADVATVRDDVRYWLQRGLEVLRHTPRAGLQAVIDLAQLERARLREDDIGFRLAPRLNALSRMDSKADASDGVELLLTDDPVQARTIAQRLEMLNVERRMATRSVTEAALKTLEQERELLMGPAIVVSGPWEPGIVGIVAGRLSDRYGKPAVVISAPEGEMARGSARSVEGIDIHAAIAAQSHLLHRYGGHPMAAGFSLAAERIPAFRRALWRTLSEAGPPVEPALAIDAYLPLGQLSLDLVEAIEVLAPFGSGNERPLFAAPDLEVVSSAEVGRTREHRRVTVRDRAEAEQQVVWWHSGDQPLPEGRFDLAYTLGSSAFRGENRLQLTWVTARERAVPPVAVVARREIRVHDYRDLIAPAAALRALWDEPNRAGQILAWGEGVTEVPGVRICDRNELSHATYLVVWSIPPGPLVLREVLSVVEPTQVALFDIDPGLDEPGAFLRRLARLARRVLSARGGEVPLARLAGQMAHTVSTVSLGLQWLACRGQIEVTWQKEGWVRLARGSGEADGELAAVQARLQDALGEAAAYRWYYRAATDPQVLVAV